MANLLPHLDQEDRALALVHGLVFVAHDTRGRAHRLPGRPLTSDGVPIERLAALVRALRGHPRVRRGGAGPRDDAQRSDRLAAPKR